MTDDETTVYDEFTAFPRGAQELSAATLARDVSASLAQAFGRCKHSQKELAELLGLTEGAVSQVLNGDGNVRIATFGRYLRAMGYEARITLEPVEEGAAPIRSRRRRRVATPEFVPSTEDVGIQFDLGAISGVHWEHHGLASALVPPSDDQQVLAYSTLSRAIVTRVWPAGLPATGWHDVVKSQVGHQLNSA